MKTRFLLLIFTISTLAHSQQNLSNNFLYADDKFSTSSLRLLKDKIREANTDAEKKSAKKTLKLSKNKAAIKLPVFGLYGASNINEETFKTLNASGKASFYFRPIVYGNKAVTIYTSYNINATNDDSVLYGTLIFPEVGKNSFLGTIEWKTYWSTEVEGGRNGHTFAPYFEFSHKNIKSDSSEKNRTLTFATLNYTFGVQYTFNIFRNAKDKKSGNTEANFFVTTYLNVFNIPDEDIEDYRAVLSKGQTFNPSSLDDDFRCWGIKLGGQIKNFGIFADFRSVLGKDSKIPLRELRGFHSNIGLILNTEIFHID